MFFPVRREVVRVKPSLSIWFPAIVSASGADTYTKRLAVALEKRGHKARIDWLPHRLEFAPWSVRKLAAPGDADIVHVNPWVPFHIQKTDKPVVATLHSCVHDDGERGAYRSLPQRLYHKHVVWHRENGALNRASSIVAVSNATAIAARKSFSRENIRVIPNWIDTDFFRPTGLVDSGKFRLLFVGQLSRRKGGDMLGPIMRELGDRYQLYVTATKRELERFGAARSNVYPLGVVSNREEMLRYYQSSDAFLFPSRLEGMSQALLEAQACGLPAVTSNASSMPEVISHKKNGLLCPVEDIRAYIEAVRLLASDQQFYLSLRKAARDRAVLNFSEPRVVEKYELLYRQCLDTA